MGVAENNKRIAKNTLMLYARMLLMMFVSLYTSRIILAALGVDDFGIYNVVGGVVVLFSFLNGAMSAATQRFLNYELGRNDAEQVGRVFGMSLLVHIWISVVVVILAETAGLWFLNSKLNIPAPRMEAANWVYQFSVAATLVGIIRVPYDATIIAHERMSFFAYLGIGEAICKLGVACLLGVFSFDKLVLFSGLIFACLFLIAFIGAIYCYRSFDSARHKLFFEKKLFYNMLNFSGWSLVGGVAYMCNTQGLNIVMNMFLGVTVNAAMGVANQVNGAIFHFVTSFQTAFNPQIVKYYAEGNKKETDFLVLRASKISFFLMLFLTLPVAVNVDFILELWLKVVPHYASAFVCVSLGYCLMDCLSNPIYTLVNATGKIRGYQLIVGFFFILNVPLAYWLLSMGLSPVWVLVSRVGVTFVMQPVRLLIARRLSGFSIRRYCVHVLFRVLGVFTLSALPAYWLSSIYAGWSALLISSTYSSLAVGLGAYFIGLDLQERRSFNLLLGPKLGFKKVTVYREQPDASITQEL